MQCISLGHAAGRDVQGPPMKRRPVMGPALLPAGTTLSMLRWSLSFTARSRGGGVSHHGQYCVSAKAASCLNWSITYDPVGSQAAGQRALEQDSLRSRTA